MSACAVAHGVCGGFAATKKMVAPMQMAVADARCRRAYPAYHLEGAGGFTTGDARQIGAQQPAIMLARHRRHAASGTYRHGHHTAGRGICNMSIDRCYGARSR